MSPLPWMLLAFGLLAADADKPAPLRYLRPDKDKFVLESEVSTIPAGKGSVYVSRTERGAEKTTLTLHLNDKGAVRVAEVVVENERRRETAKLDLRGARAQLKRGGTTDFFAAPANPIVTTAPDWSDIFTLVRRYDADKGGKQEFAGLWIHPTQPKRTLTFTIERRGNVEVKVKDKPIELTRYQVNLRGGDYLVWVQPQGVVCRIVPRKAGSPPVVLEGYEEATRRLGAPK